MDQRHHELRPSGQRCLRLLQRRGCHPPAGCGPISLILDALHYLRWRWTTPWTITADVDLLTVDLPQWAPVVREALHRCRLQPAALRRADLQGCDAQLDLDATNRACTSNYCGPSLSGTIRSVLTGSVWT